MPMTFPRSFDPLLSLVLEENRKWESGWPPFQSDTALLRTPETWAPAVAELCERLRENYPHFHPLFAGQMLKPPHPVAVVGYLAAMLVNPNNHALDGGRATATMEKEAVASLAKMFGLNENSILGHLTSSGTIANLEALWVARELHPDLPVVVSSDAHYTHKRMCALLRMPCVEIPANPSGQLDLTALDDLLLNQKVGTVVVTLGTTGLGALDPLEQVLQRKEKHPFRIHIDAAYGGYFRLLANREPSLSALAKTGEADSIVVDPHKHGLQPYGCGCVLFADSSVSRFYAHSSPYTYFSSPTHHPGETTLECSRAGAAAAALWITLKGLPLEPGGTMSQVLESCLEAARRLASALPAAGYTVFAPPTLDIVTYFPERTSASAVSAASEHIFSVAESSDPPLYLAKLVIDSPRFAALHPRVAIDAATVTLLRSCLMRPEQKEWVPRIAERLKSLNQEKSTSAP
jgi:glutamate/tyrosine decarboxylase-like PLP-dependent enzyme